MWREPTARYWTMRVIAGPRERMPWGTNEMNRLYNGIDWLLSENRRETPRFCNSNAGNAMMAANLAASAKAAGITLTYFSLDKASTERVLPYCEVVDISEDRLEPLIECESTGPNHVIFGTLHFACLAWRRYPVIKKLLGAGKNVIYLDTDIVVNRNYEEEILEILEKSECDLFTQSNHNNLPCPSLFALPRRSSCLIESIYTKENVAE